MLQRIGTGSFTTAYRVNKSEVMLDTSDPVKYHMASGFTSDSTLFPRIYSKADGLLYMKYYPKLTSLKQNLTPRHWEYYKELRRIHDETMWSFSPNALHSAIDSIKYQYLRDAVREQMISLEAHRPYDPLFECSPRNVRTHNGKLILLDCFYYATSLRETRGW